LRALKLPINIALDILIKALDIVTKVITVVYTSIVTVGQFHYLFSLWHSAVD